MLRPRNHNALYLSTCDAASIVKDDDMVIVTQLDSQTEPRCYPDWQILRPHMVDVGKKKDGTPATICYCGLTGTGVVYETPDLPDGTKREFVPITQMKNNLIILDKATGHVSTRAELSRQYNLGRCFLFIRIPPFLCFCPILTFNRINGGWLEFVICMCSFVFCITLNFILIIFYLWL